MNRRNCLVLVLLAMLFVAFTGEIASAQQPIADLKPTVILISLDGFRYDYIDKYAPPELNRLAKDGVRAKWMIPSFPTKTFPNHYTIATGLYPEHHGIVENNVFDFGEVFKIDDIKKVQDPKWWLGEPIWVTAEKQGMHAAAYFFPGTEAKIGGFLPDSWRTYNGKVPNDLRVDKLLATLDQPQATRPTVLTLYFSDTDDTGHEFGPDSDETKYAAWNVDRNISRLIDGLKTRKIDGKVNVIIVSDHGMAAADQRNVVIMDEALPKETMERDPLTTGEIWQIYPKTGRTDAIMNSLGKLKHTTCWRKVDVPARLNYNDSPRIAPVICSAEIGWHMSTQKRYDEDTAKPDFPRIEGRHGYDNKEQDMMATFIASGPAFKKGYLAEPFANVEVYNIICKILGLTPAKNDGDLSHVIGMLK